MIFIVSPVWSSGEDKFVGLWLNNDAKTRGITKLQISENNEGFIAQAWGRCHPKDCDWGKVDIEMFTRSVNDKISRWGLATWRKQYAPTTLIIRRDGDHLEVVLGCQMVPGETHKKYIMQSIIRIRTA